MYGSRGFKRKIGSAKRFSKRRKTGFRRFSSYAPRSLMGQRSAAYTAKGKGGGLAPDSIIVPLRWAQVNHLAASAGNRFVYRANSCYDPGFTTGTSQPSGFTQWSAFYNFYRVLWSKIEIEFASSTTATEVQVVSLYPSTSSAPFTANPESNQATPWCKSTIIKASTGIVKMTHYMTSRKVFGDRTDFDDDYGAAVGANPVEPWYWVVDVHTADATSASSVNDVLNVKITFGVRFESRKVLALS